MSSRTRTGGPFRTPAPDAVADGQISLVMPYTRAAPFSVGNAMGRNKIIYGLARCTIVVAADRDSGGT